MEKIPDFRIREEDPIETEAQLVQVCERMREHRLRKVELYHQQTGQVRTDSELETEPGPAINLSQTCHDRAHTESVPHTQQEEQRERPPDRRSEAASQDGRTTRQSQAGVPPPPTLVPPPPYQFSDPCPGSMRHVRIGELSSVDINWKMLTLARPTSKIDEDIFSKLVELDKLRLATRKEEARELAGRAGVDPYIVLLPPSASKGGVSEKLVRVCEECKEEFCTGTCIIFQYDSYQRLIKNSGDEEAETTDSATKKKKRSTKSAKKKK